MADENPYKDEIIISWVELHRDARYLSSVLHDKGDWKGIIAITRGGSSPPRWWRGSSTSGSSTPSAW